MPWGALGSVRFGSANAHPVAPHAALDMQRGPKDVRVALPLKSAMIVPQDLPFQTGSRLVGDATPLCRCPSRPLPPCDPSHETQPPGPRVLGDASRALRVWQAEPTWVALTGGCRFGRSPDVTY